jgi:hypothetical protein
MFAGTGTVWTLYESSAERLNAVQIRASVAQKRKHE